MAIGPVEYMIVAFPGNQFRGEIAPALRELVDAGTIRIIDLAFVLKDLDGAVVTAEMADLDSEVYKAFDALSPETYGPAERGRPGCCGRRARAQLLRRALVWEDVWATKVADAIRNAGGELLDLERLPHEVVQAAVEFSNENR